MVNDGLYVDQLNFNTGKCVLRTEIHESKIVYNGYDVVHFGDASRHVGAIVWRTGCSSDDTGFRICHDDAASYEHYAVSISN